jgi:hypothetical protein
MFSVPLYFGSILEGSSIMPNISFAAALALVKEGSCDRETPVPIEPTKTT